MTRLSATKSTVEPNIFLMSDGPVQCALLTRENHTTRRISACGCLIQKSLRVLRAMICMKSKIVYSHNGNKPNVPNPGILSWVLHFRGNAALRLLNLNRLDNRQGQR